MKLYKLPLIFAALVFSLSVIGLWMAHGHEFDQGLAFIGASYAVLCFLFLVFQIVVFIKAHLSYDHDLELVKYKVFEAEGESWEEM